MTKNKDLNYLKKLLAKEKRKEQEKVDIIGSLENRINHAELTVDSILGLENSKQRQWATIGHFISPKTGDMCIFPAQQQHWVAPFKSNVTRISVSGNLKIIYPDGLPKGYF